MRVLSNLSLLLLIPALIWALGMFYYQPLSLLLPVPFACIWLFLKKKQV